MRITLPRGDAFESGFLSQRGCLRLSTLATAADATALIEGLHSYFTDLGEKPVCTLDALPLLSTLHNTPSSQAALIDPLTTNLNGASPPSPPDLSWLRRYITLQQWRLGCGSTLTMPLDDRYTLASTYNSLYSHHIPLSKDLDSRERGHADYLPSLAAQVLMNKPTADWFGSPSGLGIHIWELKPLLGAALSLRRAHEAFPHNFQVTLSLFECYLCLGAPTAAMEVYRKLKVKYIQNESLAWILLPSIEQLGARELTDSALQEVRRFQSGGMSEVPDALGTAFKWKNYVQTLEIVALKRSLEHSWWRSLTDALMALSTLRLSTSSPNAFHSACDAAPFLTTDISSDEALAKLPDPIDVALFEEHFA